jgi:hypothetical protein
MGKRLVVCCDGTGNTPDRIDRGEVCPSNVAKLALATSDDRGTRQLLYYDKGVGTGLLDRLPGGAFGWGLSRHIQECYRFLVDGFEPGDEIFLFGFSQGAYTARSLAEACGLAFDRARLQAELKPDPLGELRDSKTGIYGLLRDAIRPIGEGSQASESLHDSALTRMRRAERPRYRPANLVRYLSRGGR